MLQHGQPVQRLVTIPEGMPSILVAEKLAAVPYLTGPVPARRRLGGWRWCRRSRSCCSAPP
jgi:hypothetical protein